MEIKPKKKSNLKIRNLIFLLFVMTASFVGSNHPIKVEAFSSDLFIRSVSHNASSDNMLELFNGTGVPVNLNNYYVSVYHNGSVNPTRTHQLPNINLPNAQAFLLAKDLSDGSYTTEERAYIAAFPLKLLLPSGSGGFHNAGGANDTYALRKDSSSGTIIDVFGMVGFNPTSFIGWTESGSNLRYGFIDPNYTKSGATNYLSTLVRRPDVINPQVSSLTYIRGTTTGMSALSFKPSEWGVYNAGTLVSTVYRFNLFDDVNDVIALINNLPNPITQNDVAAVAAARTAYDALTSAQQASVTNYADLQADEATIAGFAKIIEVIELIDLIPNPLTLADESFVTTAKTAFDDLTSAEQLQVTNRQELTDAITQINNLKAVQQLIADINALPSLTTLAQADAIASIREDYEALPLPLQELISNYATFVTKETEYLRLKGINDVEVLIDALPVPMALTDGVQLANARTAYNLLASGDQAQVGNYALLTTAENHYLDLQAAQVVIEQIDLIADPITLASRDEVSAARAALGLLTATQQDLVSNKQRLIDVETIITGLLDEVNEVINSIDALPDPISITNQAQLMNAETSFDALTDDQEVLVTNEPDLTKARTQMDAILAKIQDVISKINLIVDPVTIAQTSTIETAKAAFNALTADEKLLVTNQQKLLLAEEVITDLNTPRYAVSYVVFNQIFSEVVKSGTTVQNIPTSLNRLGYTFGGWVLEGTTTLLDLSTYIVTSGQRIVAVFNIDPTSTQSELLIEIEGLNNIDLEALFPNRDVSLQLNVDLLPVEEVPGLDANEINDLVSTQTIYTPDNIFFLDLSIVVTYVDNGISVEETLPEINEPVEITVSIPDEFREFASYQVVRVHDGEPTFLNTAYDASANSVAFSTDKFSTYGVLFSNAITDDLMARIDAISVPPTLANLASIRAIRADFDNLTADQKLMINNIQLLINAENALKELSDEIDEVNTLIIALNDPITIADESAIQELREAYDALTEEQQTYVLNLSDLTDAETQLIVVQTRIQNVIDLIFDLNHPIQIADEDAIEAVRAAYDALSFLERTYVTNVSVLLDAETDLASLYAEIDAVNDMIENLSDPINLDDEALLKEARDAYDDLTVEQQGFVNNFPSLVQAEADYQLLLDEIDAVIALIAALPNPITLDDRNIVDAARDAFNHLNVLQQERVTNQIGLLNAEARLIDLGLAEEVSDDIMILPFEDDVTLDHQEAIEAARDAYDALTPSQQDMVSADTLQHLINAENALQRLLNPPMVFDFFTLLPYHLASGFIVMILFFIKSRKKEM